MTTPSPTGELQPTYAVELTPQGRAAIAVVLVAGPDAFRVVDKCFMAGSGRPISAAPCGRIIVGRWGGIEGEELVVCRRGENETEIHCHGGIAAVRSVIDSVVAEGCHPIAWQEWLQRSRGRVECAAQIALADAVTARTAAILLDQFNGALSAAIRQAIAAVLVNDWPRAADSVDALLDWRELGMHLTTPWRVVFAGPTNVGKSSLINALAGYQRAIVSPVPGTTRDVVTATTAIDGWPVLLADTAGLRITQDELESAGVDLAQAALAGADLAILVEDASAAAAEPQPLCLLPRRIIRVRNKIDLATATEAAIAQSDSVRDTTVSTSALAGEGIAQLVIAIGKSLVPNPPADGEAVPFTTHQIEALVVARNSIERQRAPAALEALQSLLSGNY